MTYRVEWTLFAVERLEVLTEFLARKSERAAARAITDLFNRVELLGTQPEMGHVLEILEEPRIRQMYFGSYRIVYLLDPPASTLFVLAVQHGREAPYEATELQEVLDIAAATKGR